MHITHLLFQGKKMYLLPALITILSWSHSYPSYNIVDTNETLCYNTSGTITAPSVGQAFYGQDAQYVGNQPTYNNNGNGTITDVKTGLMWVQARGSKSSWAAATSGVSSCTVGNYHDWRMPTIKEVYSLIEFSGVNGTSLTSTTGYTPFINTNYFGFVYGAQGSSTERVIDCQDWSATKYVGLTQLTPSPATTIFGVNFADGRIKGYPQYNPGSTTEYTLYSRYVRGNTSYGVNSFLDNGNSTITDGATGLIWTKYDSLTGMNWQAALAYVSTKNASNYLGFNDWRLPNVKELQSIVDYTRAPAVTNSPALNPIFGCSTILDESSTLDYPFFWSGTSHLDGGITSIPASYVCFGRALGYIETFPGSGIYNVYDVHGAGAQRSDPKSGNESDYPHGHGPQGDVIRITNYVRMVRGGNLISIYMSIPKNTWELFQ